MSFVVMKRKLVQRIEEEKTMAGINWKKAVTRTTAVLMGIVMSAGFVCCTAGTAKAAESDYTVIEGDGVVFDFDNPPALPDDVVVPQVGVDEELLGNKDGFIVETFAASLVEKGISWATEKGLDFASDKLLAEIFGTENNRQMDEILEKQEKILNMLNQMLIMIKTINYKDKIDAKVQSMNSLWEKCINKQAAVADQNLTAQQRKDRLKPYFNGSGDNYVMQVIDLYTNYMEGKGMLNGNIVSTYDLYALHNYVWEHQGYDFRNSMRALDTTQFMQLWTLAYAVCEAHIQDNTPYANDAKAAQKRLMDCVSQPGTTRKDLIGLPKLMEKYPVKRLAQYYYTFQVPGKTVELYIPPQDIARIQYSQDEMTNKFNGKPAYEALESAYFNCIDPTTKERHYIADYYKTLEPIEQYYKNINGAGIREILTNITGDNIFMKSGKLEAGRFGFLQRRPFDSDPQGWSNDYKYNAYMENGPYPEFPAIGFWLDAHNDNAKIRKCISFGMDDFNKRYFAVFEAKGNKSGAQDDDSTDRAEASEVSDRGVVIDIGDDRFTLAVDLPGVAAPVTEEVLITENTEWLSGAPENGDLNSLLNFKLEVDGIYTFADGTLTASAIRIKDDSGVHEVQGAVSSNVANVVMLQEQSGSISGYFLPNPQSDIPLGSKILIRYHWENGSKTVDSYELLDDDPNNVNPDDVQENDAPAA